MSVGYLGPAGTFAEEALIALRGSADDAQPLASVRDCFAAVSAGAVTECLVPIENSLEGSVSETLDRLVAAGGALLIRAEVVHPVRHHLIGRPGLTRESVSRVLSHPHAVAQCRHFIDSQLPDAQVVASNSTAEAVQQAVTDSGADAAIGSRRAAEIYGGAILAEDIADAPDSHTRFVLIGKTPAEATGPGRFTTFIVCALNRDRPGALLAILQEFAMRGVNLTKLESRPARTGLWKYIFFIDIEGSRDRDLSIDAAISAIELQEVADVTFLGSFPVERGSG
ncbi:MAG: prephenate dehydratase [Thermoleophilia bacterium]|nr:prephenate dehydratase [Thermoleophilia bacterium]MDH3724441.1 prephenate dehydratase [Thermoleophilia bacterium]